MSACGGTLSRLARRHRGPQGHTFVELLVTVVILSVLATAALPIAAASRRRQKEVELRRALREIRQAIDVYHAMCLASVGTGGQFATTSDLRIKIENDLGLTCFPEDLDVLIEGVDTTKPGFKLRFLRRIPNDPFNPPNADFEEFDQYGWKLASTTDRVDSTMSWNKANVMDVASGSDRKALDGSFLKDW